MSEVADLSGGTAKVLLALIRRGGAWGSPAEMMAEAGVSKPTYLDAKRDLQGKFSDLVVNFLVPQVKELVPAGQLFSREVKEFDFRGQETSPWVTKVDSVHAAATATVPFTTTSAVPSQERNFPPVSEETPRQRCARADREGRDQAEAVTSAWEHVYPEQSLGLALYQAKELLGLAPAEDIYDALEMAHARGVERPLPYVRKVLSNKPRPAASASTVQAPQAPEEDHTGELADWTPEWEAKVRRGEEKLRRLGYGHLMGKEAE